MANVEVRHAPSAIEVAVHHDDDTPPNLDALTGLPSADALRERLTDAIEHARSGRHELALLCVDCDDFKTVTEVLGREHGDEVLREIARRFSRQLEENDTAARLEADHFGIVMSELTDPDEAASLAGSLLISLVEPIRMEKCQASLSASIGIAVYPRDGGDADTLLSVAADTVARIKRQGGNAYAFNRP